MKKITLGITGSIAAYKIPSLVKELSQKYEVNIVMTKSATKFVTPYVLQILSNNKVYLDLFDSEDTEVEHIKLAQKTDLLLIVPTTANFINKVANGIADDLLTTIVAAADLKKMIIAPAMNTKMYQNPIVAENLIKLKKLGVREIMPRSGLLACKEEGIGALEDLTKITEIINKELK